MKTVLYFIGRGLQIIGLGTVFIAFMHFFSDSPMGELIKLTLLGIAEFYTGNFIVTKTGIKREVMPDERHG
ncbi:MAG: hypothetical protein IEMM0002_1327 [bacterium]|nr:MAG: hypothetical protein IEMM0002_1327 [bacterium]